MNYEIGFIDYIGQVLSIKTENSFVVNDIKEELTAISNLSANAIVEFKAYMKANLADEELKYSNGLQKFIRLSERFKGLYRERLAKGIDLKARDLGLKLRTAFNSNTKENLLNPAFKFSFLKQKQNNYFTDKELYILDKLDKKKVYGLLSQPYMLEQMLLNSYKGETQKLLAKRINNTKKLSNLKQKG
jgi:hypothetical protein